MRTRLSFALFLAFISFKAFAAPPTWMSPCKIENYDGPVFCGSLQVFENRDQNSGRKIPIYTVLIPATGANRLRDPIVFLAGGPGEAATEESAFIAKQFSHLLQQRDLVFVDQRGTGKSNEFRCSFFGEAPQDYLGPLYPIEKVRACKAELSDHIDLAQYTSIDFVGDLEDVRMALAYQKINLLAGSYGTRVAFHYMRMHPGVIRAAVLTAVAPTSQRAPLSYAQDAQKSLDGLFARCAADADCKKHFDPPADLQKVLNQLDHAPANVKIQTDKTETTVTLTKSAFAERLRFMLYRDESRSQIPLLLHEAASGDFRKLTQLAYDFSRAILPAVNLALGLSVTCSEEIPFIDPAEIKKDAQGTFYGEGRYNDQALACASWPSKRASKAILEPVKFNGPVLMISGELDPVTPPHWSYDALKNLPNGKIVVIPNATHSPGECFAQLTDQFIYSGTADRLDLTCAKNIPALHFAIE